jgi:hypothetical protein
MTRRRAGSSDPDRPSARVTPGAPESTREEGGRR